MIEETKDVMHEGRSAHRYFDSAGASLARKAITFIYASFPDQVFQLFMLS